MPPCACIIVSFAAHIAYSNLALNFLIIIVHLPSCPLNCDFHEGRNQPQFVQC